MKIILSGTILLVGITLLVYAYLHQAGNPLITTIIVIVQASLCIIIAVALLLVKED